MWIAEWPPTPKHSYGCYRTGSLATLVNEATLVAISMLIFSDFAGAASATAVRPPPAPRTA